MMYIKNLIRTAARVAFFVFHLSFFILLSSCAKTEGEDTTKLEKLAFDAWMQKYVIDRGVEAVEQQSGIYVEFVEDGNQQALSARDTLVWMRMNYTSTDIEGNVFATRDSVEALRQRSFTPFTHYDPEYVYVGRSPYGMIRGRHWALQNNLVKPDGSTMKIGAGSHVRLYVPSYLAYGSSGYSNDQGYGGQFELDGTKIIIEDLKIESVVRNPLSREEEAVVDFAKVRWGLSDRDTIATCFFVDTLNFRPRPSLLATFPNKPYERRDSLGVDSTARIWFVGRFLDGFIFDTNIESVYNEFYGRRADYYNGTDKEFEALTYKPANDRSKFIAAFYNAIPALRKGQWSRIVFTSAYGYGATGMSRSLQAQQEYYQAYSDYYMQASMMNNMYGGGYYNNYYNNGYYGGMGGYYNYSPSYSTEEETEQTIVTEIQPYTPLIFEIYIEADEVEYEPEQIVGQWRLTNRESSLTGDDFYASTYTFNTDRTGFESIGERIDRTFEWTLEGNSLSLVNINYVNPEGITIMRRLYKSTPWSIRLTDDDKSLVADYSIVWDDTPHETIYRTDSFTKE